ncbi:hypothetical protein Taro_039447 [Colocasia esculenta]|uniref:Acid phosphatase 1 n=1 Tax=Colocasia esculenta TaxID=4460 RepID=A0A843W9D3_COLES|nr:hypothetical protein [Colocasia esculenta]
MHLRPLGTEDGVYAPAVMQVTGWRRVLHLLLLLAALGSGRAMGLRISWCLSVPSDDDYCLSWRVAVETNNIRGWRTVPGQCLRHVEGYMLGGQYRRDVGTVVDQIYQYARGVPFSGDGKDAWIMDVDDTCLSNLRYYQGKRFGGDPFDPVGFKAWAQMGICPALPAVLQVFNDLVAAGFKVFLLTGRDEETMGAPTTENLHNQGFLNYERLIMRGPAYKGKSAIVFKSDVRKQLVNQGYRIWGNVGDQWSDLLGDCVGDRTFKIPNPMYFVP